jgi:hypothetical protein
MRLHRAELPYPKSLGRRGTVFFSPGIGKSVIVIFKNFLD